MVRCDHCTTVGAFTGALKRSAHRYDRMGDDGFSGSPCNYLSRTPTTSRHTPGDSVQIAQTRTAVSYPLSQTINPSTTATSVAAINKVRRLKRAGSQGIAATVAAMSVGNQYEARTYNECGSKCLHSNPITLSSGKTSDSILSTLSMLNRAVPFALPMM
jgi:hypothetical protein